MSISSESVAPEITNLGLSAEGHAMLKRLRDSGVFTEMSDAYRLGISLAVRLQVTPPPLTDRTTVFGVATVDPDGKLRTAIEAVYGTSDLTPYRLAERLADWGVREIDRRRDGESLQFADIIAMSE